MINILIIIINFILPNKHIFLKNIYNKKIIYKTFFDNNKINYIKEDNNLFKNKDLLFDKLNNEIDFVFNKKIKVYIHLEQLFSNTNIYHIGVTYRSIFYKVRFDIGTFEKYNFNILKQNRIKKNFFWDYSNKTLCEVLDYEKNMEYKYKLGFYDCRHYVNNLTSWSCNNSTPIWLLYKYF